MDNRGQIISENIGLVHACAKKFKGRGIEYDDLFQAGCVGLVKAVDAFDKSRGGKLSTYAVPFIIGEIKRYIRDDGRIKVSRSIKELATKINQIQQEYTIKNGQEKILYDHCDCLYIRKTAHRQHL